MKLTLRMNSEIQSKKEFSFYDIVSLGKGRSQLYMATLPRLKSRVRIPSPAPIKQPLFYILIFLRATYASIHLHITLKKLNVKSWFHKNMGIVLGENDLGPRTKPLSNGPIANSQGPNCLSRGKLLFEKAKFMTNELKTSLNWELIIVKGVGHDNYNIAPSACKYLFDVK